MGSNDDILSRLDSRCNGLLPQRHEPLHSGFQGLSQGQILWVVVGITAVAAGESRVILAAFQFCKVKINSKINSDSNTTRAAL